MSRLPEGRMEEISKRAIVKAKKGTPTTLFRAWSNVSGGYAGLNTVIAITPRAFFTKRCSPSKKIYDLPTAEMRDMCNMHLEWQKSRNYHTEFSSWAASIQVAFHFAQRCENPQDVYISVIDTKRLDNVIVHVPALAPILGYSMHDHEYLAHGVIDGEGQKAVRMQAFLDIGVPTTWDHQLYMPIFAVAQWSLHRNDITPTEIERALGVAEQYGPKFGAAVMVAILCLKQRDGRFWRDHSAWQTSMNGMEVRLNECFLRAGFEVPETLCTEEQILTDVVYTAGYENLEQMIRMLRAIVNLRYGRGARNKMPSEKVRLRGGKK